MRTMDAVAKIRLDAAVKTTMNIAADAVDFVVVVAVADVGTRMLMVKKRSTTSIASYGAPLIHIPSKNLTITPKVINIFVVVVVVVVFRVLFAVIVIDAIVAEITRATIDAVAATVINAATPVSAASDAFDGGVI